MTSQTQAITSKDQFHRTVRALGETFSMIAKEERYSDHLRNRTYLDSLSDHAARLIQMMDAYKGEK